MQTEAQLWQKEKGGLCTQTGGFSAQVALGLKKWEILAGKKKSKYRLCLNHTLCHSRRDFQQQRKNCFWHLLGCCTHCRVATQHQRGVRGGPEKESVSQRCSKVARGAQCVGGLPSVRACPEVSWVLGLVFFRLCGYTSSSYTAHTHHCQRSTVNKSQVLLFMAVTENGKVHSGDRVWGTV